MQRIATPTGKTLYRPEVSLRENDSTSHVISFSRLNSAVCAVK